MTTLLSFLRKYAFLFFLATLSFLLSCQGSKKAFYHHHEKQWHATSLPDASQLSHTVFAIGDAGKPDSTKQEASLKALQIALENTPNSTVVFLGDNIYPIGLPGKDHPLRKQSERRLNAQLDILQDYAGNILFIPGNHDWKQGKKKGWKQVNRQEKYVEKYLDRGNVFLPDDGCPGPEVLEVNDELVVIAIDTQWWLHGHKKPKGEYDDCDVYDKHDFMLLLRETLKEHKKKQIIIAAHHPLFSNGSHGGHFRAKDHIFPLTNVNDKLYIPLPLIGSIYPTYRKFLGNIQDIAHHDYQTMKQQFMAAFGDYDNIIYMAGHEHNLQYFHEQGLHHIVSGSGSKTTYLASGKHMVYGESKKGFVKINHYKNGEVWMEFIIPEGDGSTSRVSYRKQLSPANPPSEFATTTLEKKSYNGQYVTLIPDTIYEATKSKEKLLGKQYRSTWSHPIKVPVLDIHYMYGGLTPMRKGGGMQTQSLRLQGANGHQYVLRSIQKNPRKAIPKMLQPTLAAEIVQDAISAAHPYGSLTVPPLADAAGVYHTNPRLFYVPKDDILGEYKSEFGGMLVLFEERPEGNQSDVASFGNSKKIYSSPKMISKLQEDHNNKVDEFAMLRARLLDMLIADWDRHDDQWRWASFKHKKGMTFRPIPRDRDQVYYKPDGLIPSIANRKWAMRKLQKFEEDIRDIEGQNFNARFVDRSYLTELSKEQWIAVADSMKIAITDELIDEAIKLLPEESYALEGAYITAILKERRNKLDEFAARYYEVLAREVDIVGSHKDEYFDVVRLNDEETEVTIYDIKKGKKRKKHILYRRIFKTSETKEIRLYGLQGNDKYHVSGKVKDGIMVRIISGREKDKVVVKDRVSGLRKMVKVYEATEKRKKEKNKLKLGPEAKDYTNKKAVAMEYDRKAFKYHVGLPLISVEYNKDDGIFIGGGTSITRFGFKKEPFKNKQKFLANYAAVTNAYKLNYTSVFTGIIGNWDIANSIDVKSPQYRFNYFGSGNETERFVSDDDDIDRQLYQFNIQFMDFQTGLQRTIDDIHTFNIDLTYSIINPNSELLSQDIPEVRSLIRDDFGRQVYASIGFRYQMENVDHRGLPNRGIRFQFGANYKNEIQRDEFSFIQLKSQVSFYLPIYLSRKNTTLALRMGGAHNIGDYDFYDSNFIGGTEEFRGVRKNRFAGTSSVYNNIELRVDLFDFAKHILPTTMGVLVFNDNAIVLVDDENSNEWHRSLGAGVYFSPLGQLAISGFYSKSDDDNLFNLTFGYFF